MMETKCITCRYFVSQPAINDVEYGECRRLPPENVTVKFVLREEIEAAKGSLVSRGPQPVQVIYVGEAQPSFAFRRTIPEWWCGEHEPAATGVEH